MKANINRSQEDVNKDFEDAVLEVTNTAYDNEDRVYELLAGYTDENGVLHKTFTIREMTGKDEEAIQRADVKNNGAKIISTLLIRCVMSIGTILKKDVEPKKWENIIKSLYVNDQDIILLEIRRISLGEELEANHVCPECKTKLQTVMNIDELDVRPFNGQHKIPFTLIRGYKDKRGEVHKTGFMRIPNGYDREVLTPLAKKNLAKAETTMLTRICKFDDGIYIDDDVMASLTTKDRNYLTSLMHDNNFGVKMSVVVTCDSCGEEFEANLNAVNFI